MKTHLSLIILCLLSGCAKTVVMYQEHDIVETNISPDFVGKTVSDIVVKTRGEDRDFFFQPQLYIDTKGEQSWNIASKDKSGGKLFVSVVTLPNRPTRVAVLAESKGTRNVIFNSLLSALEDKGKCKTTFVPPEHP